MEFVLRIKVNDYALEAGEAGELARLLRAIAAQVESGKATGSAQDGIGQTASWAVEPYQLPKG